MRRLPRLALVAPLLLFALLLLPRLSRQVAPTDDSRPGGDELALRRAAHLDTKHEAEGDEPGMDEPEQFARILWELKTPSDRTAPEYEPGYERRELQTAPRSANKVDLPWISRGPANVTGRTRGLIVDVSDPTNSTWFVGSVGGGIWRSTDAGATWTEMTSDLPRTPIGWLAQAPSNPDVMYAGTGEGFYNVDTINGDGVLKSVDHGVSWAVLPSTAGNLEFQNITRVIVDPADEDVVLVSSVVGFNDDTPTSQSKIWRSTDGGLNWTTVHAETVTGGGFNNRITQIIATPGDFSVQYAGVYAKGILKSTDSGQSWSYVNNGIAANMIVGRFELAVSTVDSSVVFASAMGPSHSELWRSTDAGANWTETVSTGGEPNWLGAQGWYDNTILCHPTDVDIVYVGGIRLWRLTMQNATDRTHSLLSVGPVHVDHHNLVLLDDGGGAWRILNANDGGIGVSGSEDTNWSKPTQGLVTTQFYGADKRPGRSAYFGGMQDNNTWWSPIDPDSSSDWSFAIGGDGYETSWHNDDPNKMIGAYQYNGFLRSLDGGDSWNNARNGLGDFGGGAAPFISKLAKTNDDPEFLCAVGKQGVWRTQDFAGLWSLTPIDSLEWGTVGSFMDVEISLADPDVVWAARRMDATGRVHVSTDKALSFSATTNYATVPMGSISGLSTHPTDANTAYALFSFAGRPKVLRTTDFGASWQDLSGLELGAPSTNGFPDVAVYDLLVMPHDSDQIWVATEIGIVESLDGGLTWALADNGFPSYPVWQFMHSEDEIVVSTHGRGIWSVEIPDLLAGETLRPLLESAAQLPTGPLAIHTILRSAYDSTEILVDGQVVATLPANSPMEVATAQWPVLADATVSVQLRAIVDPDTVLSPPRDVEVIAYDAPVYSYANDFESGAADFSLSGFTVSTEPQFTDAALHSPHPYANSTTLIATLNQPIIVANAPAATLEYADVAIVEPGASGTVFGDTDFWDFVIVEGTTDGMNWVPLAPGYDARDDDDWLTAYYFQDPGTEALFRTHQIDLLDSFEPGDRILLRFRLFADPGANGWGWAIDDLVIQPGPTAVDEPGAAPAAFALRANVPNPFNPATVIRYDLPRAADVALRVFDVRGRLVRTLVDEHQLAGTRTARWDGRDDRGRGVASGVYVYRLEAGDFVQQRKMTLLK